MVCLWVLQRIAQIYMKHSIVYFASQTIPRSQRISGFTPINSACATLQDRTFSEKRAPGHGGQRVTDRTAGIGAYLKSPNVGSVDFTLRP
jgi:hypothetical protein